MTIKLRCEGYEMTLCPEMGGCVLQMQHEGEDILRSAHGSDSSAWDARDLSAFPMVPFVGRLMNGEIMGPSGLVRLPANMPPEPHAIHGHGWQRGWTLVRHDEASAELDYEYDEPAWPWAYRAAQTFSLSPQGLCLTMSLTNRSDTKMPAGLGWHPYFPRYGAYLQADTTHVWLPQEDRHESIYSAPDTVQDLTTGPKVSTLNIDHAYNVRSPLQLITLPKRDVRLESDALFSKLVVYVPPGEDYFCVEPISHAPNAANLAMPQGITGLHYLAPGETLSGDIRLSATVRS